MGLVHHTATIDPTKQELVESWLPSQPWADGRAIAAKIGEYRFDDPDGEVGVETILWRTDDGSVLQTPLTYRAAPLEGAEGSLIGTTEHSVLGPRWVYDGCGDPVWAATLAAAILTGGTQAQMYIEHEGEEVAVPPRAKVHGSGSPDASVPEVSAVRSVSHDGPLALVHAGPLVLTLARVVGTAVDGDATLSGTVGDDPTTLVLAGLRAR
jgi:hypothetical protein